MILQALNDYYQRKRSQDPEALPQRGTEWKEVHFICVLDANAVLVDIEDVRIKEGSKIRGRPSLVPQAVKRSSGVAANLLWDNLAYVLGFDATTRPERLAQQHQAFVQRIVDLTKTCADPGLETLTGFLQGNPLEQAEAQVNWSALVESGGNVSFRLDGDLELICQRLVVARAIQDELTANHGDKAMCMVSGGLDQIARLHWPIKGVYKAKTTGGDIVSFNQAAFNSQGLQQGANAPVGEQAVYAYTAALNHLLRYGSPQRAVIGDTTLVFWAEQQDPVEDIFGGVLEDDPDRFTQALQVLYGAPWRGASSAPDKEIKFFVLGLAPSAARLMIRIWQIDTVAGIGERLLRHFQDLQLVHGDRESGQLPLRRLLKSLAALEKDENIAPPLVAGLLRAVVTGQPYPRALLAAAIQRNRAEQQVSFPRAALIKACINRNHSQTQEEMTVALDPENINVGYRLGRLFSVLEQVQKAANPGTTSTIRDRFYAQATTAPAAAFSRLLKLKTHHIAKLRKEKPGLAAHFEQLIGEVMDAIDDIPQLLKLEDQGRFAVGFYHQHQYRKPKDKVETEAESSEDSDLPPSQPGN